MSHQRAALYSLIQQARSSLNQVILGNTESIEIALAGLLAGGHCLIEGANGSGKTTLSKALSQLVNSDSSPTQLHNQITLTDVVRPLIDGKKPASKKLLGPMAQAIFIAENISYSSSAITQTIKQAMTEQQVLIATEHIPLADTFQIIATQHSHTDLSADINDRFLMRSVLQPLSREAERHMFRKPNRKQVLADILAVFTAGDLASIKQAIQQQYTSAHLLDYIQNITEFSRESDELTGGLSNHGALALLQAAKAYSLMQGRDHVFAEDVQAVLSATVDHRLELSNSDYSSPSQLITDKVLLFWWTLG